MNPIFAQQTVIVYRSKAEQATDEATQQFIQDHPDGIMYTFYAVFVIFGVVILYKAMKFLHRRRSLSRHRFR